MSKSVSKNTPYVAARKSVARKPMTSEIDEIQKLIIDLELISGGCEELLSGVLRDKEWRKNLNFIEDLEATVRKRQQAVMDSLNALVAQRDKKAARDE